MDNPLLRLDILKARFKNLGFSPAVSFADYLSKVEFTSLKQLQAFALACVDAAAGQVRAKHITVAPGQEATYQLKAEEALAYRATEAPVETDYPLLHAEAQATQQTLADVVQAAYATRTAWIQKAAQIEAERMRSKQKINTAVDSETIIAALETGLTHFKVL